MDSVFLVTAGAYSDFHVAAVFKTKEEAERYINGCNIDYYDVEEWEFGPQDKQMKRMWIVSDSMGGYYESGDKYCIWEEQEVGYRGKAKSNNNGATRAESVVSIDHARKLYTEEKQRLLRENASQ